MIGNKATQPNKSSSNIERTLLFFPPCSLTSLLVLSPTITETQ